MAFDQNQFILHGIAKVLVAPFLFIKSDTIDDQVTVAGANDRTLGVGPDYEVAIQESLPYTAGGFGQLQLGATVAAGDKLKSDAAGKGIKLAAATAKQNVGAIARRAGVLDDVIPVQVVIFQEDT